MTPKKKGLGKGLEALLGDAVKARASVHNIPIDKIKTNPYQPRTEFDEESIKELAQSIEAVGLIQPLVVRKLPDGTFQLIAGERRLRALKELGWATAPAYVRDVDDDINMLELALIENLQREDLNPLEIAITYQRLIEECQYTHEELANRVGKDRSTVTNYIRLLQLEPEIQAALKDGQISMGHARALLGISDKETRLKLLKEVIEKGLSVRQIEELVNRTRQIKSGRGKVVQIPIFETVSQKLSEKWAVPVKVQGRSPKKGKIVIEFRSEDEFRKILDFLGIDSNE
ncbi:MAG: ParB/RepB/Spo0J family partition protein [Chlorobi bacterium]|nr:ParB/RepB/Spo0J family partition protein [Chlorobiota bacterium]